jgi:hypothetical protein
MGRGVDALAVNMGEIGIKWMRSPLLITNARFPGKTGHAIVKIASRNGIGGGITSLS